MAFGDSNMKNPIAFDGQGKGRRPDCLRCDEMLADAVDELLEPGDQAWFDRHIATCMDCQESLAEARRGAAWLEMLKTPRPEPSAQLLERILAQTSGAEYDAMTQTAAAAVPLPADFGKAGSLPFLVPVAAPSGMEAAKPQRPQAVRPVLAFRAPAFSQALSRLLFEPRLAMTAAMAFFSIALTMNMTGIRLNELHAADLKPSTLRRSYFEATASAARHYESLRVVHVLESRVDDLREANGGLEDRPSAASQRRQSTESDRPR